MNSFNRNTGDIMETALKMYLKNGIRRVNNTDLAQQIGISTKVLQETVGNRDLLLKGVIQLFVKNMNHEIGQMIRPAKDPLEKLVWLYVLILKKFDEMNPSFMYDLKKYHREQYQTILEYGNKELFRIVTETIQEGISAGLFVADAPADSYYLMHMEKISYLINSMDRRLLANNHYLKVVLLIGEIRGMTTVKGHRILDGIDVLTQKYFQE
jgi:hypothetical protein